MNSKTQKRPRLTNGFVFKSVFGNNPELCKLLLEVALNTRIDTVEVVQPERELDIAVEARAGRVDVFVIDSEGNRYDVEIQAESHGNECLRARHYQSLMDALQLRSGTRIEELHKSIVLFVCDFDPFASGLRMYDCRTVCLQTGDAVPDGRRLVLLNAKGGGDSISPELEAFLRLVRGEEVEGSPLVDGINDIIEVYITDAAWMEQYMTFEDELEAARNAAEKRGEQRARLADIRALVENMRLDVNEIMGALGIPPEERDALRKQLGEG